jgi:hypothetical protein
MNFRMICSCETDNEKTIKRGRRPPAICFWNMLEIKQK